MSKPTRPIPTPKSPSHNCLLIAKCQILRAVSTFVQTPHIILENRTGYKRSEKLRKEGMSLGLIRRRTRILGQDTSSLDTLANNVYTLSGSTPTGPNERRQGGYAD